MRNSGAHARNILFALRAFVLLLASTAALNGQEQRGNIAGQIRLQDGSFPAERLRVTLEARGGVADVTYADSEGRFSFIDLLPNGYSVVIETEEYQPVRMMVVVNPTTAQTNIIHVVLRP